MMLQILMIMGLFLILNSFSIQNKPVKQQLNTVLKI